MVAVPGGASGCGGARGFARKRTGLLVSVARCLCSKTPAWGQWMSGVWGQASMQTLCLLWCLPSSSNVPQCCAFGSSLGSPSSNLCCFLPGFLLPRSARSSSFLLSTCLFICSEFCDWLRLPLLGEAVSFSHSCLPSDSICFPASSLGPSGEIRRWLFGRAP